MKKIMALILTLCLLAASSTIAVAEAATDFSAYSDAELLVLLAEVQSEISARKIEKTAHLTAGTYIGGRDIPVGTYILATAGSEGEYGIVSLRSSMTRRMTIPPSSMSSKTARMCIPFSSRLKRAIR